MAHYRLSFEIDEYGLSPLEVVKTVQNMIKEGDYQWYVQNVETNELFSVDLAEDDEDAVLPVKEYQSFIKPVKVVKQITEAEFEAAKAVLIKEQEAEKEAAIDRRQIAMQWFNALTPTAKEMHTDCKYKGRTPRSLTGREIENMYYNV